MSIRPEWLAERWAEANALRDAYLARTPSPSPRDAWEGGARWGWAAGLALSSVGLPEESGFFGVRVVYPSGNAQGYTLRDPRLPAGSSEMSRLAAELRALADRLEAEEVEGHDD